MKYLIIGDLHLGIKNHSERYYNLIHREFFKWLDINFANKNYGLIFLGDLTHQRKYINNLILSKAIDVFNVYQKDFLEIISITGNHDYYYRDSKTGGYINILERVFNHIPNLEVINKIKIDEEKKIVYFPFNYNLEHLPKKDYSDYLCLGHFELESLYYDSEVALSDEFFNQFNKTISGHFHQPLIKNNFEYIGTPFDIQYNPKNSEDDQKRKIIEFDTETRETKYHYYDIRQFYTFIVNDDLSFKNFFNKSKKLKTKNIRIFIENTFRYGMKKNVLENFVKTLENENEEIRLEYFDGILSEDNNTLVEDSLKDRISIFSDNDLKETIVKMIDIGYENKDKNDFKNFVYNIVDEFANKQG